MWERSPYLLAHDRGLADTLFDGPDPFVLGHEIRRAGDRDRGRMRRHRDPGCSRPLHTLRGEIDRAAVCQLRAGWSSSCLNLDSRVVSTGRTLGYTQNLGGGWSEQVLAHSSMLHPLPDAVSDRGSSLFEPVSIACHGLLRSPPENGAPVLVVGAGIIGLATLAALRGLIPTPRSLCSPATCTMPPRLRAGLRT